jgi:hypothetical protein
MNKTPPKSADAIQSARFIKTARQLEADESPEAFERALKRIAPAKKPPKKSRR